MIFFSPNCHLPPDAQRAHNRSCYPPFLLGPMPPALHELRGATRVFLLAAAPPGPGPSASGWIVCSCEDRVTYVPPPARGLLTPGQPDGSHTPGDPRHDGL